MLCEGAKAFNLKNCEGEVQKIKDVEKNKKQKVLSFGKGILSDETELCCHHLAVFGKQTKTVCADPFKEHTKAHGKYSMTGESFILVQNANPGLVNPHDTLCIKCFSKACKPIESVVDVADSEPDNELSDSEASQSRFSPEKLHKLNSILEILSLPQLGKFEKRNTAGKVKMITEAANSVKDAILDLLLVEVKKPEQNLVVSISSLKEKLQDASRNEKIIIASLFAGDLTLQKTRETFDLSERAARISLNLYKSQRVLSAPPKKTMKTLSKDTESLVRSFYERDEFSRVSPKMKDVIKRTNADGTTEDVSKRFLVCSIKELYAKFKSEYPEEEHKIGRTMFFQLRPTNCEPLKMGHREVCLCIYHENIKLLYAGVGIRDYSSFLEYLVCDKEKKICMFRECDVCNSYGEKFVDELRKYILEKYPKYEEMDINYKQWSQNDRELLISCSLNIEDYLQHMAKRCSEFLKHHFTAKQQARSFKNMKCNVDEKTAIIQCDFAENYSPFYDQEVQKAFFAKQSITIHPFAITLLVNKEPKTIWTAVVSDEMHHATNTYFVFQKTLLNWLKSEYPLIDNVVYFSDGAASQYKNFKNFSNLRHHKHDFDLHASHHFFASCHGKGSCDAIGGVLKCKARRASFAGTTIQTAEEFYAYVSAQVPSVKCFFVSSSEVEKVINDAQLEQRYATSQKIPNIRQVHAVKVVEDKLSLYELSQDTQPCAAGRFSVDEAPFDAFVVDEGDWIAGVYDNIWYYGRVQKVVPDSEELIVLYLCDPGESKSTFSKFEKRPISVPYCQIIQKVSAPSKPTRRTFMFDEETRLQVMRKFSNM